MNLFNLSDISEHQDAETGMSQSFGETVRQSNAIGKGALALGEIMPETLEKGDLIHFFSDGCWSMHHLCSHLLKITGPADIHLATWSISEFSARQLVGWLQTGLVRSLTGVIDFRSKNRHAEAFHLAKSNFTKLRLANCHAKITVLHNESWKILIHGSPNWTENPRMESGIISVSDSAADRFIRIIEEICTKSEYELD